jgi:hypothetical protein
MKPSFSYDPSEPLDLLEKVDAPPFMFTRIMQKVSDVYEQQVSPSIAWVGSILLVGIFALNIWIVSNSPNKQTKKSAQLQSLVFLPNNSLYE